MASELDIKVNLKRLSYRDELSKFNMERDIAVFSQSTTLTNHNKMEQQRNACCSVGGISTS